MDHNQRQRIFLTGSVINRVGVHGRFNSQACFDLLSTPLLATLSTLPATVDGFRLTLPVRDVG
jgi:hypothetical protein